MNFTEGCELVTHPIFHRCIPKLLIPVDPVAMEGPPKGIPQPFAQEKEAEQAAFHSVQGKSRGRRAGISLPGGDGTCVPVLGTASGVGSGRGAAWCYRRGGGSS